MSSKVDLVSGVSLLSSVHSSINPVCDNPPSIPSADFFVATPVEIILHILKNLTCQELCIIAQVNKELKFFASDEAIWKRLCLSYINTNSKCDTCKQGIFNAVNRRASIDSIPWMKLFKETCASHSQAKWGPVWHKHRFPSSIRTNTVEYSSKDTTVTNIHGGWNLVQFGSFSLLPFGLYHYTFTVDQFPCNGMMIALATGQWKGVYPGSGNAGITTADKSIAYYSHNASVFAAGDTICLCVDMDKRVVVFHKNEETVGTQELPSTSSDCELYVIGAFCGNQHRLTISYAHHT